MEMHLRKLRMLQTCKKYGNVLRAPEMLSKRNTLIWDLKDNLIYCRIAKVSLWPVRRGLSVNLFIAGGAHSKIETSSHKSAGRKRKPAKILLGQKSAWQQSVKRSVISPTDSTLVHLQALHHQHVHSDQDWQNVTFLQQDFPDFCIKSSQESWEFLGWHPALYTRQCP